jgi:hypothetical protein
MHAHGGSTCGTIRAILGATSHLTVSALIEGGLTKELKVTVDTRHSLVRFSGGPFDGHTAVLPGGENVFHVAQVDDQIVVMTDEFVCDIEPAIVNKMAPVRHKYINAHDHVCRLYRYFGQD